MRSTEDLTRKFKPHRSPFGVRAMLLWTSFAFLTLAQTGCHNKKADGVEEKKEVVEVATTHPQRKDMTRAVLQPGYLRPFEMTPIYTKIAGFAKEPLYDIGDHVKKGELLVELRVPEDDQTLIVKGAKIKQARADQTQAEEAANAAKANVEASRANVKAKLAAIRSADAEVKRWSGEVERARTLLAKGVYDVQTLEQDINQWRSSEAKRDEALANHVSAEANLIKASAYYNKAEADVLVAIANVEVAQATHDQWKDWLSYAQITAPFDGVITDRKVHTGHFLQPSNSGSTSKAAEPLFVIMRTDIMRCTVEVPELDALLIRRGDKAVIQFQAIPGFEIVGEVERTTKALDEHTRTLRVEVHLRNPKGAKVRYSASASGAITSVDPVPPSETAHIWSSNFSFEIPAGGAGYPPNTTIQLQVLGDKGGKGCIVNATTNASGAVVRYSLHAGGKKYAPDTNVTANTFSDRMLRPNMYANVAIYPQLRSAWVLPPEAVMSDILANGDRRYCFVVEDGKVHKVFLEIGALCEEGQQVLRKQRLGSAEWENFTGNEVIATTNTKALQDGQEVHVKAP